MRAIKMVKPLRLIVLAVLLALSALLVGGRSERGALVQKKPLQQALQSFGGWQSQQSFPMDDKIVQALNLDDYLYQLYRRDRKEVSLYIGYYRSAKKVGAAHDPLVCFQGQGWHITRREAGEYPLTRHPGVTVSYSSMVADHQEDRELVLYWFQVNGKANASTERQKLAMVLDRIAGRSEESAFVRLSVPLRGGSPEEARRLIFDFIEDFYPEFLRYVTEG